MSYFRWSCQALGRSRGGLTTKIHAVVTGPDSLIGFSVGPGNAHDAPAGEALLHEALPPRAAAVLMDRAYGSRSIRSMLSRWGVEAVVPPKSNAREPWEYDRGLYRKRNEIERFFNRLKNFRRVATRYDKLASMFAAFVTLGAIMLLLKNVNTA